jgi:hypothetical protein
MKLTGQQNRKDSGMNQPLLQSQLPQSLRLPSRLLFEQVAKLALRKKSF